MLRGAALPGASALLWAVAHPRVLRATRGTAEALKARGNSKAVYLEQFVRAMRPLEGAGSRQAFLHSLRSVIDPRGQRVSARDRLYLLEGMPTMVVWGERDNTIPLAHGRAAHEAIPGSRLVTLPKAAHFPHLEDPAGLSQAIEEFLVSTEAACMTEQDWQELVAHRSRRTLRVAA
jgi:pimeloyl-ACP methyl ester carboxylesterase